MLLKRFLIEKINFLFLILKKNRKLKVKSFNSKINLNLGCGLDVTKNFDYLKKFFANYRNYFKLPEQNPGVKTPWLAFPLVIKKNKKFNRKQMQIFFEKNNIQTRTIFTGNILKQPVMKNRIYKKHPNCDAVANDVMKNGILLGCHQGMNIKDLNYICSTFKKFIK